MVATRPRTILGKIAGGISSALEARTKSGAPAATRATPLASGAGWEVFDVVCTAGPRDRIFEEQHRGHTAAVVVGGTFQYRTSRGLYLMTPGSLFLGNASECFECGHDHAAGDRCVSFKFTHDFVDGLAADLGERRATFAASRVAPARASSKVVAGVAAGLVSGAISWEEAAIEVASVALRADGGDSRFSKAPARDVLERATRAVRAIDRDPSADHELRALAAAAELSPFQFLRAFRRATGTTPHQYLLRTRLRESAASLRDGGRTIAELALRCGFNDLSNFNHAFRAEFGLSPRAYRAAHGIGTALRPCPARDSSSSFADGRSDPEHE